ncbi:MAG: deoxynucleoside kinase, partial [Thermanaerothrix sp.]|nr:deoxynucleoside kinase [Thermanaerothrix sp.]
GLYLQGALSERDYATYRALYQAACDCLTPPDLMIYLRASTPTLQRRIAQRRRPYEREIPLAYLERLNALYEAWVAGFTLCPVLTVPADDLDYVARPRHFELVLQKVQEKLTGKEEVRFDPAEVA